MAANNSAQVQLVPTEAVPLPAAENPGESWWLWGVVVLLIVIGALAVRRFAKRRRRHPG